jgi:hypothetical protein
MAMGTSFVEYGKFGFWTRDSYLSSWLTTLLNELRRTPKAEPWQETLMDHWRVQIKIDGGCMSAGLSEFLTDGDRRDSLIFICNAALSNCEPSAKRKGELFVALLLGTPRTTVSSRIDYLGDVS